jgi:anti-anti-sigma regulatory factor
MPFFQKKPVVIEARQLTHVDSMEDEELKKLLQEMNDAN